MLQIAANWIEQEKKDIEAAKEAYMAENCPTPDMSGDQAALMVRPWRAQNIPVNTVNTMEHQGSITFLLYTPSWSNSAPEKKDTPLRQQSCWRNDNIS